MNINMLMQQAQRMQKDMEGNVKKAKEELAQTEVHAEAGGTRSAVGYGKLSALA